MKTDGWNGFHVASSNVNLGGVRSQSMALGRSAHAGLSPRSFGDETDRIEGPKE